MLGAHGERATGAGLGQLERIGRDVALYHVARHTAIDGNTTATATGCGHAANGAAERSIYRDRHWRGNDGIGQRCADAKGITAVTHQVDRHCTTDGALRTTGDRASERLNCTRLSGMHSQRRSATEDIARRHLGTGAAVEPVDAGRSRQCEVFTARQSGRERFNAALCIGQHRDRLAGSDSGGKNLRRARALDSIKTKGQCT